VRVRVVGLNSSEVVEAVRAGDLEAGMVSLPIDDRGLDVQPIMREEILYASTDPAHVRTPATIEELASRPLILADASYGARIPCAASSPSWPSASASPSSRRSTSRTSRPALELAARGLGDTIVSRGILLAMGRRVSKRLGWVPFDEPFYTTFAFVSRANAPLSPAVARVPRAGARGAGRAGPQAAHRPAAPADAGLTFSRAAARAVAAQAAQEGVGRPWG
jgi:hypothetical protein